MTNSFRTRGAPPPPRVEQKTLRYKDDEAHLLRRLGSALVLQWDSLPDELQDRLIDQAAAVEDREDGAHEAADVERFIRGAKVVALTKAADAGGK